MNVNFLLMFVLFYTDLYIFQNVYLSWSQDFTMVIPLKNYCDFKSEKLFYRTFE